MRTTSQHLDQKKRLTRLLAGLTVGAFLQMGAAAAAEVERTSLATSVVTPFFGAYYLECKVRASDTVAVVLNTSYLSMSDDDWKTRAGTIGAGVDYYFGRTALRGWYLEAIGEGWLTSRRHEPSATVAPLGVGYAGIALVGYQFIFRRGPIVDLGAGVVAFHLPNRRVELADGPVSSGALTRVYPAAKINVGWAF